MAKGKPSTWVSVKVRESIKVGKKGLEIKIRGRGSRSKRGIFTISVGGITWKPYNAKKGKTVNWKNLERYISER